MMVGVWVLGYGGGVEVVVGVWVLEYGGGMVGACMLE